MESKKIRKLKNLWDGIKHIACAVWGEYIPVRRKEIKAEELEELCEMISPLFSRFMEHLNEQGIETSEREDKRFSDMFYMTFASLFPEEINNKVEILIEQSRRIFAERNRYLGEVDYSFLESMILDTETVFAWIKDKGLEKHILFYEHRSSYVSGESFWSAAKEFLAERWHDNPNSEYSADARMLGYMSRWSFIFNRKVVKASSSIEIKNLQIIGSSHINFERFACVVFIRNVFCESVKIEATRHRRILDERKRESGFIFCENTFRDYHINFIGIHYLIFDQNDFTQNITLFNVRSNPKIPNNAIYQYGDVCPTIRLINNKVKKQLTMKGDNAPDTGYYGNSFKVEFLRKNRLTGLCIHTRENGLGGGIMSELKSDIKKISFDVHEEIKPTDTDLNLLEQYKNFFLGLKNQAIKKKDRTTELIYARQERYFDRRLSSRWEDRLIFWSSEFVSKSGTSWVRPLTLLSISQMIFIGLPVWLITKDCELGVRLAIETLNPLTTLSAKLSEESYWISFLTIFQKIYLSIILYETIKVLRRFSK